MKISIGLLLLFFKLIPIIIIYLYYDRYTVLKVLIISLLLDKYFYIVLVHKAVI